MSDIKEAVKELQDGAVQEKVSTEFGPDQALNILVQGIKIATKRGAFELEETEMLLKAIKVFIK